MNRNAVFLASLFHMLHCLMNNFFQKFCIQPKLHSTIFNPGNRKQVFHQINQPQGIIVNIFIQLSALFPVHTFFTGQQNPCISRNRCQRRPQIMRNGAQQIGTKLFILCQKRSGGSFFGNFVIFHSQGTFAQNRQHNTFFKGIRSAFSNSNSHYAKHITAHSYGQIQEFCFRKSFRSRTCMNIVFQHPSGNLRFLR